MTETTTPASLATVVEVLCAIDRAGLLHVLPPEEAATLTTPVIRAANGVELSVAEQRAAARAMAAARQWLAGPLASLGLSIPPPPDPVTPVASRAASVGKAPTAALVDGGARIGVRNVFALVEQVKALPGARPVGRNHAYTKFVPVFTVPATPAGARGLLEVLGPFGPKVSLGVSALADQFEAVRDGRALLEDGAELPEVDTDSYGVGADLWHHQRRGVAWGELSPAVLFAMKMGAGKTISAIALANRVQAHRVMIVAPNRVRAVWTREVRERSTVGWHIEDGTRPPARRGGRRQDLPHPERLARAQHLFFDCDCGAPVHAFVINYEALSQRVWQEWEPADRLDLIIYDEAHRLKNYLTKVKSKKPVGRHTRDARDHPAATEAMVRAARMADEMGPRERKLLPLTYAMLVREARGEPEPDQPPTLVDTDDQGAVRAARAVDRAEAKADEDFRSRKLTVSGVAARWVEFSHRRVALSGTPFPQHPWDIFGLYRALDPGVFGLVWTPFKERWLEMDRTGTYPKGVRDDMIDEFAHLAMSLMYRPVVDLQLPPITDVVREVFLEDKARRTYDELDEALKTDLSRYIEAAARGDALLVDSADVTGEGVEVDGVTELNASNLLSRLLRLQQLTGGTLRTDPHKDPTTGRRVAGREARVSTAKADELAEFEGGRLVGGILAEIGCHSDAPDGPEPTVVFCRFRSDMDAVRQVAEKAGLRYGEISGRRGDGLDADARMSDDVDVCAVQIQAGGTGVDLTRAAYAVWYSLGYSVSDADQARARLHRPGQTRPVVNIHLIAADTMDQAVYDAIHARKAAVSAILRAGGVDPAAVGLHESDPDLELPGGSGMVAGSPVRLPWETS